jgi:HK97 family phage portal protein
MPTSMGVASGWRPLGGYGVGGSPARTVAALSTYGATEDSSATVFACTTLIADMLAGYEWAIIDQKDQILEPGQVDQDLYQFLEHPAPDHTYFDWVADAETDLLLVGDSFWLKDQMNAFGQPNNLERFMPGQVRIVTNNRDQKIGYVVTVANQQIAFGLDDVIHYRTRNPLNKHYGMGVVEALLRDIGLDVAQSAHINSFFVNGARIAGVLTVADEMDDKQFERLKRQVDEQYGGPANAYRTLIAEKSADFKPVTVPPAALGIVDLSNLAEDKILQGFGVPKFMLGGREEGGVPKMQQSQYIFYRRMVPRARRFSERTTLDLVSRWEGMRYAIIPINDEPPSERYSNAKNLAMAWASPNQVLEAAGLPQVDDPKYDIPMPPNTVNTAYAFWLLGGGIKPPGLNPGNQPGGGGGGSGAQNEPTPGSDPNDPTTPNEDKPKDEQQQQQAWWPTMEDVMPAFPSSDFLSEGLPRRPLTTGSQRSLGTLALPPGRRVDGMSPAVRAVLAEVLPGFDMNGNGNGNGHAPVKQITTTVLVKVPDLPDGFEYRGPLVDPGAATSAAAQIILDGQARFFIRSTPRIRSVMTNFFNDQRLRMVDALAGFTTRRLGNPRATKSPLTDVSDIWDEDGERAMLLAAYVGLLDELGADAIRPGSRAANVTLAWDLGNENVMDARKALSDLAMRINETTKKRLAAVIQDGLSRGYNMGQIANGFQDIGSDGQPVGLRFPGIHGVFDEATGDRVEVIARSESALIFGRASSAAYREAQRHRLQIFDGTGDEACADWAGRVVTVDEYEANLIGHPNCVRTAAPAGDE